MGRTAFMHIYGSWSDTNNMWSDDDNSFYWGDLDSTINYPSHHYINTSIVTSDKVCVYTLTEKSTGVTTSGIVRVSQNNDFSFGHINT